MKAVFTNHSRRSYLIVHFDCELPILMMEVAVGRMRDRLILSRSSDLAKLAPEIAAANVGRFHQETLDAKAAYREFLNDLLFIEGLERVHDSGRYLMEIMVGECFDNATVCQRVATVVQRHFYRDSELTIENRLNPPADPITTQHVPV